MTEPVVAQPFEFRWRIHPAASPEETAAELVFTQPADANTGQLEITARNPSLKALVYYYLADPAGHRPLFFRDLGTVVGPHLHTFGQIDRSLMDFNRQFPAYQAARISPFPAGQAAHDAPAGDAPPDEAAR